MKSTKINFSKLIGCYYPLDVKMEVLNWMLKTGKGLDHSYGWHRDGINKSLFSYSANNHDCIVPLPKETELFFDAIFARALLLKENEPLKKWRSNESIYLGKYRMLKFNMELPNADGVPPFLPWLINDIRKLNGKFLKKEFHHPEYKNRTDPKIIDILIYTVGNGWIVQYGFSFKEMDYESGWRNGFTQQSTESVWSFLYRSYNELSQLIISA